MVDVEVWRVKEIAEALSSKNDIKNEKNTDRKKIEVPKYQRNLVWSDSQKKLFIDSLVKEFPIGTLLLYKDKEGHYKLIDGLQRSSTLKDYINNPTFYFDPKNDIEDEIIKNLYGKLDIKEDFEIFNENVRASIKNCIDSTLFKDINSANIAEKLVEIYCSDILSSKNYNEVKPFIKEVENILKDNINAYRDRYDKIAEARVPAIVFSGNDADLPTVFERINNNGTQLSKYQIYAATWATREKKVVVKNEEIIRKVIEKYDSFINEGYTLDNYDREELLEKKELTIFEYVLGFGKFIASEYENLFKADKDAQDINQIGFELFNACFKRDISGIEELDKVLSELDDIADFETKLRDTIKVVSDYLRPFIEFKGNTRNSTSSTIYHSKYQILSIIAFVFKERYKKIDNHFEEIDKKSWADKNKKFKNAIPQRYFYDILNKNWSEGSQGELHRIINDDKHYFNPISKDIWNSTLNNWFISSLEKRDSVKQVKNPQPIEKLFLNYVYLEKFSSKDEKSQDNFDIEHLCTKNYMKKIMLKNKWEQGLPVSSIGNICYLPEYDNRTKHENTIYQDEKYLKYLKSKGKSLKDIEDKFTLTSEEGMSWLKEKYGQKDYEKFLDLYKKFLTDRFGKMKILFYKTLEINVEEEKDRIVGL